MPDNSIIDLSQLSTTLSDYQVGTMVNSTF